MRPSLLAALVPFLGSALAANGIAFTNPPPPGGLLEPANNPVYAEGSTIQISWSGKAQIAFSVVLYTIGVTPDGGYDIPNDREPTADILGKSPCWPRAPCKFVFLTNQLSAADVVGLQSTPWVVGTPQGVYKDRMFYLNFYLQGNPVGQALTHWFNISSRPDEAKSTAQTATPRTTSSSSSSSVLLPTGSSSSTAASKSTPTLTSTSASASASASNSTAASTLSSASTSTSAPTSTSTLAPDAANDDGGLGTAAKAGLAVGVVAAVILSAAWAWFWWRRRAGSGGAVEIDGSQRTRPRTGVHEADVWERPSELDAGPRLYELGGS